ncbi:hypothetical protein [Mucilaginibacter xinganensis]|uniref:Uncharacterized protein n=1 Tax=Mucilaginibacter xinganensis TaxID=1234841 RepID=A0A223P135_9SPHI|nr:hypothetical protein [Mucilaginibacter xinganensis]ASU35859.1 hypothetical protein MuYL_3974 [Mucilaginibacter xinganensis]
MPAENEAPATATQQSNKPPLTGNISVWLGIITSIITVALTIYTAYNKAKIDGLEDKLKERSTTIEESREKVERYKWVFSLYQDLTDTDKRKSKFAGSLITLALTDAESTKLFAGLQTSTDKVLQNLGKNGLTTIGNGTIVALVSKIDTLSVPDRTSAVGELEKNYASSPVAITLVLNLYNPDNIKTMSSNGVINGLYYLNRTTAKVWSRQQIDQGREVAARIAALNPGTKTKNELANFVKFLNKASGGI